MKKAFTLMIIVIIVCTACSNNQELKTGTYINTENTDYGQAGVILSDNNEFSFYFQGLSYVAIGKYTIVDNSLTLTVNDNEQYIFTLDNGNLIFESGEWAEKLLDKGAIFQISNE